MLALVDSDRDVWVIVPAYNEAEPLGALLATLCQQPYRVVVVDDGSSDATAEVAGRHPVYLLRHLCNLGQGAALRTGLDFALARGAGILVTFDADGQHGADDIQRLVDPILEGRVDVTLGSRFLGRAEGLPISRRCILKLGVLFTRVFSQVRVTDTHNGLRGFSRDAARKIPITEDGMAHASQILDEIRRQKLRFCEVPVHVRYTDRTLQKGQSNWNAVKVAGKFLVGRILR